MTNFKKTLITTVLLALFPVSSLFAAQEISPEQADSLVPFKEISSRGTYQSFSDASRVISKLADKEGADYFYITSMNMYNSNESLRIVYAKLYKKDAAEKEEVEKLRQFRGIYEYPKNKAIQIEPFDIVKIRGYYPNQHDINDAVAKAAKGKDAYAFYIDRQVEGNGRNTEVTAYLFKADSPVRLIQPDDAIPYDSEAGQQALAQGGAAALQVEKPGYYSSSDFNEDYYTNKFNAEKSQSSALKDDSDKSLANKDVNPTIDTVKSTTTVTKSNAVITSDKAPESKESVAIPKSTRYSVTLPSGVRIEELNNATAAKMIPFDSIKFRGYYVSDTDISYQAAKRAADKGAKFYHITRISEDSRGPNRTIYVDLFK